MSSSNHHSIMKIITFFLALVGLITIAFAGAIPQDDIALAGDITPNVRTRPMLVT